MSKKFSYYGSISSAQHIMDKVAGSFFGVSFRKLRAGYSGFCCRIRVGVILTDIGFVGDFVDTAAMLAAAGGGSAFIETWYDQSGNGYNVVQAVGVNQPRIVNSGVLQLDSNGELAARFDGTNDRMVSSSFTLQGQPYSVYGVWQGLNNTIEYAFDGSVTNRSTVGNIGAAGAWRLVSNLAGDFAGGTYTPINRANIPILQFGCFNGVNSRMVINDFIYLALSNAGLTGIDRVTLGSNASLAGQFWNGFINEAVAFSGDKLPDIPTIQTDVNTFYNIY
jgi:hypothetical protein